MIDYLAIALTHGLLALAAWQLLRRDDLDSEPDEAEVTRRAVKQAPRV